MQHKHPSNNWARRQFGRVALSSVAAIALAACGGGGGDGADTDNQRNLRDVYNNLEDGMGPEEVTALVGRTADGIGGTSYDWRTSTESLDIDFNNKHGTQISGAYWYIGSSQSRSKSFKEV